MTNYIIKNCPCRMELHEDDCFGHTGYNNCCACTDCVLKQIVELCKCHTELCKNCEQQIKECDCSDICNAYRLDKILQLLDIQEVE